MNTIRRVIKNSASLLASGIIVRLFNFIVIIYFSRVLGPENMGKIYFAFAIFSYFNLFVNMGLPMVGTREIAKNKEETGFLTANIVGIRLFLAGLSIIILLVFVYFLNKPFDIKNLVFVYGLCVIPSALLIDWVFQGQEKMEYIAISQIIANGLNFLLIICYVKGPDQIFLIPCIALLTSFLPVVILYFAFKSIFRSGGFTINFSRWKPLLQSSIVIGLSMFMVQIIFNSDLVILGFLRTDKDVGCYNAAYRLMWIFHMTGMAYFDAIFPLISRFFNESLDSLKKLLSFSAKLICNTAIPLAFGCTMLAKPLIELTFGKMFGESILALQILIWSLVFVLLNNVYCRALVGCNEEKAYLKVLAIQAVSNIVLNIILIGPYGLVGAGIATIFAEFVGLILYYKALCKIIVAPYLGYVIKPFMASLPMAFFCYVTTYVYEMNIVIQIPCAIIIYLMVLYAIKGLYKEEILFVKDLLIKRIEKNAGV